MAKTIGLWLYGIWSISRTFKTFYAVIFIEHDFDLSYLYIASFSEMKLPVQFTDKVVNVFISITVIYNYFKLTKIKSYKKSPVFLF